MPYVAELIKHIRGRIDGIAYLARKFHRTPVEASTALPCECPFIEVLNLDERAGNAESKLYRTG